MSEQIREKLLILCEIYHNFDLNLKRAYAMYISLVCLCYCVAIVSNCIVVVAFVILFFIFIFVLFCFQLMKKKKLFIRIREFVGFFLSFIHSSIHSLFLYISFIFSSLCSVFPVLSQAYSLLFCHFYHVFSKHQHAFWCYDRQKNLMYCFHTYIQTVSACVWVYVWLCIIERGSRNRVKERQGKR